MPTRAPASAVAVSGPAYPARTRGSPPQLPARRTGARGRAVRSRSRAAEQSGAARCPPSPAGVHSDQSGPATVRPELVNQPGPRHVSTCAPRRRGRAADRARPRTAADGATFRLLETVLAGPIHRGHRRSPRPDGSGDNDAYSLEAEFDDLAGVVEALHEPALVFGHSFGANVALGAALRRSRKIEKLVLYEPGTGKKRLRVAQRARAAARARRRASRDASYAARVHSLPGGVARRPARHATLAGAAVYAHTSRGSSGRTRNTITAIVGPTPTLIVVGGESPADELVHGQALAARLPLARVLCSTVKAISPRPRRHSGSPARFAVRVGEPPGLRICPRV